MTVFLEYADTSLLQAYLAELAGVNLIQVLEGKQRPWQIFKPSSIQEAEQNVNSNGGLFGEETISLNLISLENLSLTPSLLEGIVALLETVETHNIVHIGPENSLIAEQKKAWQKAGGKYETLKKADSHVKSRLLQDYSAQLGLHFTPAQSQQLIEQAVNYQEILDMIDLIWLSGDVNQAAASLVVEQKPLPFMLGFNLSRLTTDVKNWHRSIGEDEIQLALSLIFTKLDKQGGVQADKLLAKLIRTDQRIKTSSKAPAAVWWKYFLWETSSNR